MILSFLVVFVESVVFVEEEFLYKKIQKEDVFGDLNAKPTKRKVVRNSMEAY